MNASHRIAGAALGAALTATPLTALAGVAHSTVGVGGYDLVSYHESKKPLPGNGNFVTVHEGVTYLFSSQDNKKTFDASPAKYLPAYGGWCAYGVSVGKKFVGDPNVWEVVDGRLYLNLDHSIQNLWSKDIPKHIATADRQWTKIRNSDPADL